MTIAHQAARPVTDDAWDWRRSAACGGLDVEIFYHPDGERGHRKNARITRAKQICRRCPVLSDCATWALSTREPYGIWGGMSEDERADILGVRSLKYPALAPDRPTDRLSVPGALHQQPPHRSGAARYD